MAKREKIKSKESVAKKLFWVPSAIMVILTLLLMCLKWNSSESLKHNFIVTLEVLLTYLAGPLFIGYILFSLGMMKEIDDKQWENQENQEEKKSSIS